MEIRYFSPELAVSTPTAGQAPVPAAAGAAPTGARVLIGRLTSSASLRYRIVHRESPVETEEYDSLRWTDLPETYVRHSLTRALEGARLEIATGGSSPILDLDVVCFEETRRGGRRAGRVALRYQVRDEHSILASDIVVMERDAAGPGFDPVVVAIGSAMESATARVSNAVAARLVKNPQRGRDALAGPQ